MHNVEAKRSRQRLAQGSHGFLNENSGQNHQGGREASQGGCDPNAPPPFHDDAIAGSGSQDQGAKQANQGQRIEHEPTLPAAGRAVTAIQAISAVVGVGTLIITAFQLGAMNDQLNEMKTSGIDTHALAIAAEKQSTALVSQAETMKDQLAVFRKQLNIFIDQQRA